jgi:hypothetical protein
MMKEKIENRLHLQTNTKEKKKMIMTYGYDGAEITVTPVNAK